eukprot:Skav232963  [mRNA]  locus=scaffold1735:114132:114884:- [translate_table: standard]
MVTVTVGYFNAVRSCPAWGSVVRVVKCCQEDGDFEFAGDPILKSTAGIFTMCFCRPGTCAISFDFKAALGFFTARGPFPVKTVCLEGHECSWPLLGIGLNVGDRLVFRKHGCQDWNDEEQTVSKEFQLFMQIPEPFEAKDRGNGLEVDLGTLPYEGQPGPGVYQICWCPSESDCALADKFRASAGDLQIECAPGLDGGFIFMSIFFSCNCFRGIWIDFFQDYRKCIADEMRMVSMFRVDHADDKEIRIPL